MYRQLPFQFANCPHGTRLKGRRRLHGNLSLVGKTYQNLSFCISSILFFVQFVKMWVDQPLASQSAT